MKKHQFKALVREIIRGIVSERNLANAERKRAWQSQTGGRVFTQRSNNLSHDAGKASAAGDYDRAASANAQARDQAALGQDPTARVRAGRQASQAGREVSPTLRGPRAQTGPTDAGVAASGQARLRQKAGIRVKNPETGQEILATSALSAGPTHPAYQAAKAALTQKENTLLLKNLIRENMERRLNLMKISAIMEKVLPEVSKDQVNKLSELFTETSMLATQMNTMPHTKFNMMEWKLSVGMVHSKLYELKEEVMKICEKEDRVDLMPLVRAIEEACQQ